MGAQTAHQGSIQCQLPRACPTPGLLATLHAKPRTTTTTKTVGRSLRLPSFLCRVLGLDSLLGRRAASLRPVPAPRQTRNPATGLGTVSGCKSCRARLGGRANRARHQIQAGPPHLPCALGGEAPVTEWTTSHGPVLPPTPSRSQGWKEARSTRQLLWQLQSRIYPSQRPGSWIPAGLSLRPPGD